jgi:hypothetical protein
MNEMTLKQFINEDSDLIDEVICKQVPLADIENEERRLWILKRSL